MISVSGLVKRYEGRDGQKTAVTGLNFEVEAGKLVTLLGPSGCGKTTTLRMIAGLERPTAGAIRLDGTTVYDSHKGVLIPANRRPLGMVFQSYAIWPHMTVIQNVAFPLTVGENRPSRDVVRTRALAMLDIVGLAEEADRPATALSGGQQQRVALARALVREPKVLLFDEPLSNLDAQMRERMRGEIRALQQSLRITALYVTHDQNEALAISDVIMLMNKGEIVETGQPQTIYRRPQTQFTANFIGVANAIDGTVRASDETKLVVQTALGSMTAAPSPLLQNGDSVRVFIRPENITLTRKRHSADDWSGTVRYSVYQGECWDYAVDVNGTELRVRVHKEKIGLGHGDEVHLSPDGSEAVVMRLRDGVVSAIPMNGVPASAAF